MTTMIEYQAATLARAECDIQAAAGTAVFLEGAKVHLTKTAIDINIGTTLAELAAEEADYNTYASQVLVWDDPSVADDGTVEVTCAALVWRPTDAVDPNMIWAAYITNGASSVLYFANQLDEAPVPMNSTLDQMIMIVRYRPASQTVVTILT